MTIRIAPKGATRNTIAAAISQPASIRNLSSEFRGGENAYVLRTCVDVMVDHWIGAVGASNQ